MQKKFAPSPCGPFNQKLEHQMQQKISSANAVLSIREAQENSDLGPNAVRRCQKMLHRALWKQRKVLCGEAWDKLVGAAAAEGPSTLRLCHMTHELQRLQICLGEKTLEEAIQELRQSAIATCPPKAPKPAAPKPNPTAPKATESSVTTTKSPAAMWRRFVQGNIQ